MEAISQSKPMSRWDTREHLLSRYREALKNHIFTPFLYPWSTVAAGLVLAYLLIPQGQSRLVRRLRFMVWAINTVVSLYGIIFTRMRLSLGYGGGLLSAWAILWTNVVLLNNNVQQDFRRLESVQSTLYITPNMYTDEDNNITTTKPHRDQTYTRYQWEPFPHNSLRKRLLWVADLFTGLRGIGWNWQLPTLAPLPLHVRKQLGEETTEDSSTGRDGTRRYDKRDELLRRRTVEFVVCYLSLDLLIIMATHDPYFWGVVDSPAPAFLPSVIQHSAFLCRAYRNVSTMLAVYAALQFFFAIGPLVFVGLLGSNRIGVWGEPWAYPDVWGSFRKVIDYGLIGFWGSWWHQAFRYAFESNASAMVSALKLDEKDQAGKVAKLLFAFSLSGFLHASGSYASLGDSRPFSGSFLFFIVQPLGIMIQMVLKHFLREAGVAARAPRSVQQLFTLSLTYLWLHVTAPLLCDDFARTGIWMIEPLPISPLRALGLGDSQDGWWCWRGSGATWYRGKYWWQTGIAL